MDLQITKKDGTSLVLSDHDIFIDDFKVSSIPINGIYGSPEGIAGRIDYGATYGDRTITVPFHLKAYDLLDYPLARDALFDLVLSTESFFIRELRRPKLLQYDFVDFTESAFDTNGKRKFSEGTDNVGIGGKRYLVRVANQFDVEQLLESKTGEGEIVFETTELPFAESIGTSYDIEKKVLADSSSILPLNADKWENGAISFNGGDFDRNTSLRIIGYIPVEPEQEYEFSVAKGKQIFIREYDSNTVFVDGPSRGVLEGNSRLVTMSPTTEFVRVYFNTDEIVTPDDIGVTLSMSIVSMKKKHAGVSFESELWSFGMGLLTDDWSLVYAHETNNFSIYNPGNVSVHPFMQDIKIIISNVVGSTDYLQLRNDTNGSVFKVNESVSDSQTIILDGPNITSNGLAYLRKTNRGFIELNPGRNDFTVTGGVSAKIEFDFRFYYL